MYILVVSDENFHLHKQYSFPNHVEASVHGFPPEYHSYDQYLKQLITEFGTIVSSKQNNDTRSTWILEDNYKITAEAIWLSPVDDPYDFRFHDDADLEA